MSDPADGELQWVPLTALRAHPANSNVMPADRLATLQAHIERTGRYPPLIVRPLPSQPVQPPDEAEGRPHDAEDSEKTKAHLPPSRPRAIVADSPSPAAEPCYQVLDGHHRWRALEALGRAGAWCSVWAVDEAEALVLLATLNRLEGADDPRKRGALLRSLRERLAASAGELARWLPESRGDVEKLLAAAEPPPPPRPAPALDAMPVSVHFFLRPAERTRLEAALKRLGGTREQALMRLVEGEVMSDER